MTPIVIEIPGIAKPGGSKKAFAFRRKNGKLGVSVTDDAKGNADWKSLVALCASKAMGGKPPLASALHIDVDFYLPRPAGHFGKRGLKQSAPPYHTVRPDATKLWRSTEDALRGIVFRDDSQVVIQCVHKRYSDKAYTVVAVHELERTA